MSIVLTMQATRLRRILEKNLKDNGHPQLDTIVKRARKDGVGWAPLAADVSTRSGEPVSYETLRQWYAHLEEPTTATGGAA